MADDEDTSIDFSMKKKKVSSRPETWQICSAFHLAVAAPLVPQHFAARRSLR